MNSFKPKVIGTFCDFKSKTIFTEPFYNGQEVIVRKNADYKRDSYFIINHQKTHFEFWGINERCKVNSLFNAFITKSMEAYKEEL